MDVVCAATAGVLGRFPCHPLDTLKTVAFVGGYDPQQTPSKGVWSVGRMIYRTEGLKGFYRGAGIAVAGAAPGNVLYLLTYQESKRLVTPLIEGPNTSWALRSSSHLMCGVIAEAASCVVWVPVDVVKERLQSQPPHLRGRYGNSWDAAATIFRNESFVGLYKGYLSTLASFGPYSGIYFVTLEAIDTLLSPWQQAWKLQSSSSMFVCSLLNAGIANAVAAISTTPIEMIKTRLQVQRAILNVDGHKRKSGQFSYEYRSVLDGFRSVVREEGFCGLWKGSAARVLYACPNAALTMALFRTFQNNIACS